MAKTNKDGRRDSLGWLLKVRESQRKDGLYEYRFTDLEGKRRFIYDQDLKKGAEVSAMRNDGIDYGSGEITVLQLLERYIALKRGVRENTIAGFLLLERNRNHKVAGHIHKVFKRIWLKYNDTHVITLPQITTHLFRHTFCTNMANVWMNLKTLQYLIGYFDATVTMNVYAHNGYEKAAQSMAEILSGAAEVNKRITEYSQ